jgi:hypothetical protein
MRGIIRVRDVYVMEPDDPALGIELTNSVKARFPFIPGSGEFNSAPVKNLAEMDARLSR